MQANKETFVSLDDSGCSMKCQLKVEKLLYKGYVY